MIWIILLKGQPIPSGLHVRINLATGEKEAKLLEDDADNSKTIAVTVNSTIFQNISLALLCIL